MDSWARDGFRLEGKLLKDIKAHVDYSAKTDKAAYAEKEFTLQKVFHPTEGVACRRARKAVGGRFGHFQEQETRRGIVSGSFRG